MTRNTRYYLFVFICFLLTGNLYAQLSLKVGAESGLYMAENSLLTDDQKVEARLDAKLAYTFSEINRSVQADLRIRPETYGLSNDLSALKVKASGSYFQHEREFNWGINFNTYYYNFSINNKSSDFLVYDLRTDIFKPFSSSGSFILEAGYTYRINRSESDLSINSLLVDLMFISNISNGLNLGAGVYIENFHSNYKSDITNEALRDKNTGTRFGPMFSIDYLGSYILRGTSYFIFHNSDITKPVSMEYLASLVFGKKLSSAMTLMLLIDYYQNSFRFISNIHSEKYLYFPSNIENQIAVKLGYDLSNQTEIYLKGGYFKLDFLSDQNPLTGWNLLAGIQVSL